MRRAILPLAEISGGSDCQLCYLRGRKKMELQFADVSKAQAGRLAEELELNLIQAGVPATALSLKRSSSEAMDPGSALWVAVEAASHILGPLGYIACFGKCIYDLVKRHGAPVVILTKSGP